jgi:hypothetical protein
VGPSGGGLQDVCNGIPPSTRSASATRNPIWDRPLRGRACYHGADSARSAGRCRGIERFAHGIQG